MLTVPGQKIPRKIAIRVGKAEQLKETKKGKNKVNNKFKVTVLGGKNKESSTVEISENGNVQWTFSCIIKLHKTQSDPLVLLVEDSDGHHKGQVVIPIVKIPPKPYTYNAIQDPAISTNILCSELEPTIKCDNPSGFLLYWIWVEQYYDDQLTLGKKSINKSMSSLFGSKNKLGSSKTNLEIKNSDLINNFGSHSNLNKTEKHKKSSSFMNLKNGGNKKKSKPTSSDFRITPDSSDMDSSSNFSFIPVNSVNPFENDPDLLKNDRMSIKNSSLADEENIAKASKRYSNDSYHSKEDIQNYENHNNFSEAQFGVKSGNKETVVAFDSISKLEKTSYPSQQASQELTNGKTLLMMALTSNKKIQNEETVKDTNPFSSNMVPIVMPPYTNENTVSSDNNSSFKQHSNSLASSTLPNKYNTMKDLPTHKEFPFNNEPITSISSQNEIESTYRPGHNKSTIGSDYSIFSQHSNQLPSQPIHKGNIDESENIKKENTELKLLNSRLGQQINDLTNELDSVKQILCNLRLKLLNEGATKYLEI